MLRSLPLFSSLDWERLEQLQLDAPLGPYMVVGSSLGGATASTPAGHARSGLRALETVGA